MLPIQRLRQLIQTALDNYDRDRGWLRRAQPEDLIAKIIARLMNRQIGDPPSIHRLREILRGFPADADDQAIASSEQLWPLIDCLYNTPRAAPPSLTTTIIDQLQHDLSAQFPTHIAEAFDDLQQAGILNQENVTAIVQHPQHAQNIAQVFAVLQRAGILNPENREALLQHPEHAKHIAKAFLYLQQDNILNLENRAATVQHPQDAENIAQAFVYLQRANILNLENREAMLQHPQQARDIAQVFLYLQHVGMFDPKNRAVILSRPQHAEDIARAFRDLHRTRILNQANVTLLLQHAQYAEEIARAFALLQRASILTPENRAAILQHPKRAVGLGSAIYALARGKILDQGNLDKLLAEPTRALLIARELGGKADTYDPAIQDFNEIQNAACFFHCSNASTILPPEIRAKIAAHAAGNLDWESAFAIATASLNVGDARTEDAGASTTYGAGGAPSLSAPR
ncbi:MAG: hypothetical protein A3H43_00065 [Gammaproteobacteria bacterium RIFCSPLOWO2_02_FULL_42_9]|nr:MAG: hypothetical protein A3H43_00065 [Gammaproteobacteria bacterium RIFCSPLOWO2_02_FULL_42_9]